MVKGEVVAKETGKCWECNSLRLQLRMSEHSIFGDQPRARYVVVLKYLLNAFKTVNE